MEEQKTENNTQTIKSLQKMIKTDFGALKEEIAKLKREIDVVRKSLQNRR